MKRLLLLATFAFCALPSFAQWTPLNSGTTAQLNDIYFTNATTGYAGGAGGVLLKTINGGATWTTLPAFTSGNIREIYFTDANTGWFNIESAGLYRTTDGGQTFQDLLPAFGSLPAGYQVRASSMTFNGPVAIIGGFFADSPQSGPGLSIWKKTTDGGQTWTTLNTPAQYAYTSTIRILNADTLFLADFWLHRSVNGGQSWDTLGGPLPFPPLNNKCFQLFDGAGNGAVGLGYLLGFATLDATPDTVIVNAQGNQQSTAAISFPAGKTGYLLNRSYTSGSGIDVIKKTTDGGHTQQTLSVPSGFTAVNMHFVTESLGFTCGENGVIYKTTNGGGTLAIADPSKNQPNIFVFPNPATEWFTIPQSALPFQKAELFSVDGKKVKTIAAGTTDVDVRGLPAGQYLLLLQNGVKTETVKLEILGK